MDRSPRGGGPAGPPPPGSGKFKGITSEQSAALESSLNLAAKSFKTVIKQIDTRGAVWLAGVVIKAQLDAQQQQTVTTGS
jgi:hypothetical protein